MFLRSTGELHGKGKWATHSTDKNSALINT